ncbi:unnamed protein product [Angiostrongylus costaricensis]|uniref:Retrovirus-related Pol polyprotein from transposon TNT 1-94 n=1 Tax=Angiostrongylus costaricensis TaxID=334426 RepID=A0A158PHE8_ANGCS|nr:unnamed protein product [Angiostrongylus costaricensis]
MNEEDALVSGEVIEKNCSLNTDGRTMACYTCMGRDMANCLHGITCCKGSCFKLIDADHADSNEFADEGQQWDQVMILDKLKKRIIIEHDMVVKGCTNDDEEDASMKVRTLNVGLYWVYQEKVKGKS